MKRLPFSRGAHHFAQSGLRHGVGNPYRFAAAARLPKLYAWLGGFGFLGLGLLVYWLFFSPAFQVRKISLQAGLSLPQATLTALVKEQLQQFRLRIFPQHNIFALDTFALGQRLKQAFIVEQVFIKKDRPDTVQVRITEKPRSAIWVSRGQAYALDSQGLTIGRTRLPPAPGDELVIYDSSGGAVGNNSPALTAAHLAFLARLVQNVQIQTLGPRFFIIERPQATEVTLKVKEGWQIHFNMDNALEEQLGNLELTLRNTVAPDKRAALDYIDLRFGERVYVKYR
ncbi:hypothetical protein HYW17_04925 [Candidatus Uhrbacteria bacterium]|nr:hypothetical protein [Candidatus Uhrbacteria bacterium]